MTEYRAYFEENWALLQQAELYLPQPNLTFRNPDFAAADYRVLIVRLSPFRDVNRSTPHLFLYQAVRRALPGAYIDMAFFPPEHDRRRFAADEIPFLIGCQSCRSVADFDLVLISNAYTLELLNLPYLFLQSGVPLLASERDATWPLFLLGGSNALAMQALITPTGDSFADAIFFGEGEGQVTPLIGALHAHRAAPKAVRLQTAAEYVTGLWIANGGPAQRVKKAICPAPAAEDLLTEYPRLNSAEAGTARLQINFGCPAFCSFCFEGYDRKPYREIPLTDVLAAADRLKTATGATTLELYSFNFNTHADILTLLLELNRRFDRVRFMSQRVDLLATTPGLLTAEVAADKRSFTLGIEGISARMRAFLHKSLETGTLMGVLGALLREKIRELKLFYILTGHETAADLQEFRDFVRTLKALRRRINPGIRIVFSAGRLVRMPFTPLRYDRLFLDEDDWTPIVGPVKSACETNGFEFRLATPWDEYCTSQVLALGGYWLADAVRALAEAGHHYDTHLTPGCWDALRAWMQEQGLWDDRFLGEKFPAYAFPLDFVTAAIGADFLYRKFQEAQAGVDTGYCLGSADKPAQCLGCGACVTPEQRRALLTHRMEPPAARDYWRAFPALMHEKWRLKPVYVRLRVPPELAGVDPAWRDAWALRHLLAAVPALAENLLVAEERLFTVGDNAEHFAGVTGETVFALKAWDTDALQTVLAPESDPTRLVGFREFAVDFEPGVFHELDLELRLPAAHFPAAGQQLRAYLQAHYVPVNLRRAGEGYVFDVPQKALKKKALFAGRFVEREGVFTAQLHLGPKFDLLGYLRSFADSGHYREMRAEVAKIVW